MATANLLSHPIVDKSFAIIVALILIRIVHDDIGHLITVTEQQNVILAGDRADEAAFRAEVRAMHNETVRDIREYDRPTR